MIGLTAFKGLRILGPTLDVSDRIPMVSFSIDDVHAHDLATMLDEYGIAVRAGHHCAQPLLRRFDMASAVRVSLGLYNSSADCSYFLDKLSKSVSFFR